jgi:hypothetical protein
VIAAARTNASKAEPTKRMVVMGVSATIAPSLHGPFHD